VKTVGTQVHSGDEIAILGNQLSHETP